MVSIQLVVFHVLKCTFQCSLWVLLDGDHDLDVLESAVCGGVVRVAAGDARAVAHGDGGGGQLYQALVLPISRQFICKAQPQVLRTPFCS